MDRVDYEDHCWLHAGGSDVRIVRMETLSRIWCVDTLGRVVVLDLSDLRRNEYAEKAREYLRFAWGLP